MAYPALIQKILALRQDMQDVHDEEGTFASAIIELAEQSIRMSGRITALELGAGHSNLPPVYYTYCPPEGYDLLCGAKVAPLTIANDGQAIHRGAAFTVVLDEISNS